MPHAASQFISVLVVVVFVAIHMQVHFLKAVYNSAECVCCTKLWHFNEVSQIACNFLHNLFDCYDFPIQCAVKFRIYQKHNSRFCERIEMNM